MPPAWMAFCRQMGALLWRVKSLGCGTAVIWAWGGWLSTGAAAVPIQDGLVQDGPALAPPYSVVVYNIENLFDLDGVALFEDYQGERYQAAHLLVKLQNAARILKLARAGEGPDIILFQELEADQTPAGRAIGPQTRLEPYASVPLAELLQDPVPADVRDWPVEVFLLKALQEAGLGSYHVAVADYRPDPTGRTVAHVNATFSRFPIRGATTHHSPGARGILEVTHEVEGTTLTSFNNHWKSGASDPESEVIRRGNATTLRERLDQIFAQDPHADLIVGGDFNSQYNQSQAYPEMGQTGINTVLQSQGDELALCGPLTGGLYNLWFELPKSQRGSDVYRDQWGTLMQIMIPRGLYDKRGIQYVDNSFRVLRQENVNAQAGSQLPIRWAQVGPIGGGYSDHFPLEMQFHVVATSDRMAYLSLETPGTPDVSSDQAPARSVDFAAAKRATVRSLNDLGSDAAVCDPGNLGHVFQVEAVVSGERPFRVRLFEQDYNLWAFDVDLRREIYRRFAVGQAIKIHAEVGIHQEQWQLVVRDRSWIDP